MSHRNKPEGLGDTGLPKKPTSPAWAVVVVLLGIGIVVPLLVPLYAREEPSLAGFPFFFWFQFVLIPVVSLLTFISFRISQAARAKDRRHVGLPADPEHHDDDNDEDGR